MPLDERRPWPWSEQDLVRLRHMLDAARGIDAFVSGCTRDSLRHDDIPTLGLLKAIEIIGEAASMIDPSVHDAIPSVPWSRIIGMRHRLVHAYFDIDLDIVWATATKAMPQLATELENFLKKWNVADVFP